MLKKIILLLFIMVIIISICIEIKYSYVQANFFSQITSNLKYWKESNKSENIRFPKTGPYDIRLGYVRIPDWVYEMSQKDFFVKEQAHSSKSLIRLTELGVFPIYHEKNQAGLKILDDKDIEVFNSKYPERIYSTFEAIPDHVVKTLLFIENRELLNPEYPYHNPAIEWQRLGKALTDMTFSLFNKDYSVAGGSTLATQLEKFRHSPDGITFTPIDKIRQVISASFRAYLDGKITLNTQKKIFLNYINSIPFAAISKYGEINGLGDALWAWFEADFDEVNMLLNDNNPLTLNISKKAMAYREVLSLLVSHRRPSIYLIKDRDGLHKLVDSYLYKLASTGIISTELYAEALKIKPYFRKEMNITNSSSFAKWKTSNILRTKLLSDLKIGNLYNLDRLDLTVKSTIRMDAQESVVEMLKNLQEPQNPYSAALSGPYLLEKGDPSNVTYSFSLYEHTSKYNLLLVQANSFEGPFNIDESTKLDLGSTAKLRTLITYLEIIESCYHRYYSISKSELNLFLKNKNSDILTQWSINYIMNTPKHSLKSILETSLNRIYSGNPGEQFFTGGGVHKFVNFHKNDNLKIFTVKEALAHSINLVFIRIMRDIVNHFIFQRTGTNLHHLENLEESEKKRYLHIFADREGKVFLSRFYSKYNGKTSDEIFETLVSGTQSNPVHLAAIFRYIKPKDSFQRFYDFMLQNLSYSTLSEDAFYKLFNNYTADKYSLADRGYIVSIHPLELWIAKYKFNNPDANLSEIINKSSDERQLVYKWLFKTRYKGAQLSRIRTMLELEAFQDIHQSWKKLGYPFDFLVPSYATSIGSSGDKPSALAELMGILVSSGKRYPIVRFKKLHFAENTPFETVLEIKPSEGKKVLSKELVDTAKNALTNVVESGTAIRLKNTLKLNDGSIIKAGGKTGTGDHRYKTFGANAQLISSRIVNRTATFVFFIGDRFFGIITAFVPGEDAGDYVFTSALPVQLLKILWPSIHPLIEGY